MSSNYTAILKYERRGSTVVPILTRMEKNGADGPLRSVRVTELAFFPPPTPEVTAGFVEAETDGYQAFRQVNSRFALQAFGALVGPADWPDDQPFLALDADARVVHARDMANNYGGCDNPWVRGLFSDEADDAGELDE